MSEVFGAEPFARFAREFERVVVSVLAKVGLVAPKPPKEIGPHESRELALFLEGRKPLVLLSEWDDCAAFDGLVEQGGACLRTACVPIKLRREGFAGRVFGLTEMSEHELRFYAAPADHWRLEAIATIYASHFGKRRFTEFEHATIGWLLGYSEGEIAAFLDWRRKLHRRG